MEAELAANRPTTSSVPDQEHLDTVCIVIVVFEYRVNSNN